MFDGLVELRVVRRADNVTKKILMSKDKMTLKPLDKGKVKVSFQPKRDKADEGRSKEETN